MRREKGSRLRRRQKQFALVALSPVMIYMGVFVILPVIMAFINSFLDTSTRAFVGIANYREFLFEDPRGPASIRNTFVYALIRIPATIIIGFFIANALDRIRYARGTMIFGFFAPYVTNMVAFSAVFLYLYANTGLFNTLLRSLNLPTMSFTRSLTQALPSIALMDAWKHIGFDVVVFLAALKAVPKTFYEAARIDGASGFQMVRFIKIPLLRPTILYLLVMIFIWTMQVFEPIYVMTGGGPLNATRTIVFSIYQAGFRQFRLGYASAIAYIEFILIMIVTLIQLRVGRTTWSY